MRATTRSLRLNVRIVLTIECLGHLSDRSSVGAHSLLWDLLLRLEDIVVNIVDNLTLRSDSAHQIVNVFVKSGIKTSNFFIFTLHLSLASSQFFVSNSQFLFQFLDLGHINTRWYITKTFLLHLDLTHIPRKCDLIEVFGHVQQTLGPICLCERTDTRIMELLGELNKYRPLFHSFPFTLVLFFSESRVGRNWPYKRTRKSITRNERVRIQKPCKRMSVFVLKRSTLSFHQPLHYRQTLGFREQAIHISFIHYQKLLMCILLRRLLVIYPFGFIFPMRVEDIGSVSSEPSFSTSCSAMEDHTSLLLISP